MVGNVSGLSRTAPANPQAAAAAACKDPCCQRFESREALIAQGRERARHQTANGGDGAALNAAADRFETYNSGIIRARAAAAVYEDEGAPHCLDRLTTAEANDALGFPAGHLTDADFRNDETGFKAEMFRSRSDGSLILAYRGTEPNMLIDWETNVQNGLGRDTAQYRQARELARTISQSDVPFDIAGHSKGGGIASMAAAVTPGVQATTFNSAGVAPSLVNSVGGSTLGLNDRINAFHFDDEFLTSMQSLTDPAQKIQRAEQLLSEIEGTAGTINPMTAEFTNPATEAEFASHSRWTRAGRAGRQAVQDQFALDRQRFLDDFGAEIETARGLMNSGDNLEGYFPPALGNPVDMGDPPNDFLNRTLNDRLSALRNHTMEPVLTRMEAIKDEDQATLRGG